MTRRRALLVAAAVLVSVVAIIIGWQLGQSRKGAEEIIEVDVPELEVADGPTFTIDLFFPGPGGNLYREEREVPVQEDLLLQLNRILQELVAGPTTEDLFPALPPEITPGWMHLNQAGVLYVDLQFTGERSFPAWGSRHEMLAAFSVVNSLVAAAPEIQSVVLLRNGQQQPTFAGHLDTTRPLSANSQLIASP